MGKKRDALEAHIKSELSRIEAHKQHDPDDDAVWENEREKLLEWVKGERKRVDKEDEEES